ncbi:MAG: hypothetical protein ACK4YP_26320, partial [Myxococcota bacterium]
YTRDGARLLAADAGGPALLDDRGQVRTRLACAQADGKGVVDASAAPDRSAFAARYADGSVCAWDAAGALLGTPAKDATAVAVGLDELVVVGFADGRLEGRRGRTGAKRWMRNPELGRVTHLRFERSGRRVAASTPTLGVAVVDTRSGRLVRGIRGAPAFSSVFDPTGATLAVGRANGRVEIWDATHWVAKRTVRFATGNVVDLDWSPDGSQLAAAVETGIGLDRAVVLEVYDLVAEELVLREAAPAGPGPTRLRYDAVGDRLVVGNGPGASRVWSRPGARAIPRPPPSDEPPHQRPFVDPPALPPLTVAPPERVVPGALAVSADGARALVWTEAAAPLAPEGAPAKAVAPTGTVAPGLPPGLAVVHLATGVAVPLPGAASGEGPFGLTPDGGRVAAWSKDRLL